MTKFEACLAEAGAQWASTGEAIARVLGAMILELDGNVSAGKNVPRVEDVRLERLEDSFKKIWLEFTALSDSRVADVERRLVEIEKLIGETVVPALERLAERQETAIAVVDDGVIPDAHRLREELRALERRFDQADFRERR